MRHEYDGADRPPFQLLGYIQMAGNRHPGWIQDSVPGTAHRLIDLVEYRKPA
ncbi:MAG: hypothetical protein ACRDPY_32885 [Streptosporangiaceae bacterium]